ncbi:MAG: DUF116 domain-containing protein [Endomicrobiia bacterium]|nr:DUF116 domain-containing protein [Endomicrobiaceae bacterium]MDD3053635.1 DUF116 domain-containing protein [Endomicrobiaceae bacterium]MDD3922322.1 DUF116 domain-containing protein [Endomicrobiaceae bacterium]MDD5101463.1 DUF116 domain-containing protein [Endomicrobiaceae bacterium]
MNVCLNFKKINKNNYQNFINKKNQSMFNKFKLVDFSDRVIFVPHCMRNTKMCKAKDEGSYYTCMQCNECKIAEIFSLSKELGYKKFYIMKGGKAIHNILKHEKPKAIIGIACFFEGAQAIKMTDKEKILVQFIPLLKDGCCDTDVDLEEAKKIISLK